MTIIKQVLVISLIIFSVLILLVYFFQRHLLYFPDPHTPKLAKFHAEDMNVVSLQTSDKLELKAWYKAARKNQPTVLFLHGNAGHIGYRMPLIRKFLDAGLGVLLLEYRGYGGNPGKPSEHGLYFDAQAGMQFLIHHGVPTKDIVFYGESLGTGVATYLATEYPSCALILQAPFTSMVSLARYHYPWVFIEPWDKFDSLSRMKTIQSPLLVLHGTLDSIVPYDEGLAIFNAANKPKQLLTFDNKEHNNLWNSPDFAQNVVHFIKANCKR